MMKKLLATLFVLVCSSAVAAFAGTYGNLDQISGWKSCDACSGQFQTGPTVIRTVTQNLTSPSMDGKSMKLSISGSVSNGSALFWKGMGSTTARHFTTDLYFYMNNPKVSRALEFDIYQDLNKRHLVLGMECSLMNTSSWRVYDTTYQHWRNTYIPCKPPSAYKWHHLITEQESTTDGHSHMISLTIDGTKYYINKYYGSRAGSSSPQATIGLQLDGDTNMDSYSVWYDKVTVKTY